MSTQTAEKATTDIVTTNNGKPGNPSAIVQKQIDQYIQSGKLHLPENYSPENALKSAWLILQSVVDKDKRPALKVCTPESVVNSLMSMVIQGLNPDKKQCYFIVYGSQLLCQRSYFGDEALAVRVSHQPIEFYTGVVYDGDAFEIEIIRGRKSILKHSTKLENQDVRKIKAAYCGTINRETGEDLGAEIMTWDQIQASWAMSKQRSDNSPHAKFPDQMAIRTVLRRRSKPIINASDDALLMQAIRHSEQAETIGDMDEEVAREANGEIIDMPSEPSALEAPAEVLEAALTPETVAEVKEEGYKAEF